MLLDKYKTLRTHLSKNITTSTIISLHAFDQRPTNIQPNLQCSNRMYFHHLPSCFLRPDECFTALPRNSVKHKQHLDIDGLYECGCNINVYFILNYDLIKDFILCHINLFSTISHT